MKKKILLRGMLGIPAGILIGYFISIIISLIWAGGYYVPCKPELVSVIGNEIYAVLLQTLLCGLMGGGFAAASVIWDAESWGIVKQTGIYFFVVSLIMLPVAYVAYWMEHSLSGFLSYFGIFILIFAVIWVIEFLVGKQHVKKMNAGLSKARSEKANEAGHF